MRLANELRSLKIKASTRLGEERNVDIMAASKKDRTYLILLYIIAALLLLVCSRNSYAFLYQEWGDPIIYMNVGRAIRGGAVLYRDIFDHKGPLLPLVFAALSMISPFPFSMSGLYLFQCVTLSLTLRYLYRTARLFLNPAPSVGVCFGFLFFLLNGLTYGQGGGSAEELLLPAFMGALYEIVKRFGPQIGIDALQLTSTVPIGQSNRRDPAFFRLGLFVGIIALVKINLALFPVVITLFLLIPYIFSRDLRGFVKASVRFAAGGLTAAAPCALYIWSTNSFSSFWEVYIDFNLRYAGQSGNTKDSLTFFGAAAESAYLNLAAVLCILIGLGCFIANHKQISRLGQTGLAIGFLALFASVFAAHRAYPYLFIPLTIFAGLAEISIVATFLRLYNRLRHGQSKASAVSSRRIFLAGIATVLVVAASNGSWAETRWLRTEKTGTQRIAELILTKWRQENRDTSPNILMFNSGEIGFYQLTESVPKLRYFYAPMIDYSVYPDVIDSQIGYIRDGIPDYVIFLSHEEEFYYDFSGVNPAYTMVARDKQKAGGSLYITLYEKQETA